MRKRRGSSRVERSSIGKYLTDLRIASGETQEEVAAKFGDKGKSRSYVCRIEIGKRTKNLLEGITLYQIAAAYGTSVVEILKQGESIQLPLMKIGDNDKEENSDPLLNVTAEERQELIHYLKEMRGNKGK